jgi:hypothetical protein
MANFVEQTKLDEKGAFKRLLVDIINPLDTLPVVKNLGAGAQTASSNDPGDILGAGLIGGPAGFLMKMATTLFSAARAGPDAYAHQDPYESGRASDRGVDLSV